nr:hypothetical protein [Streptomyces hygroscopicus]
MDGAGPEGPEGAEGAVGPEATPGPGRGPDACAAEFFSHPAATSNSAKTISAAAHAGSARAKSSTRHAVSAPPA